MNTRDPDAAYALTRAEERAVLTLGAPETASPYDLEVLSGLVGKLKDRRRVREARMRGVAA